jgi:hypothetical protein
MTDGSNRCQYATGYFAGASASSPGAVGFTGAQFLPSVISANTPTMAVAGQSVFVLWRDPESRLYCNTLTDVMAGAAPSPILLNGQPAISSDSPAAYEALGGLFVIWKGAGSDGTIYSALYNVNTNSWNSFATLPGYTSQNSPEPIQPEPIRIRREF